MPDIRIFLVAALLGLIFHGPVAAEMYKWVDGNGVTHYSDSPPPKAESAKQLTVRPTTSASPPPADRVTAPVPAPPPKAEVKPQPPPKVKPAAAPVKKTGPPKVELYTTSWCPYCEKARKYFRMRGIAFIEYDVEKDKNADRRRKQLVSEKGVPFAVVNGKRILGYQEAEYAKALKGQ